MVKVKCHQLPTTSNSQQVHIPTKLHQFLITSFRDFMQTDRHRCRDTQTDAAKNNTYLQHART